MFADYIYHVLVPATMSYSLLGGDAGTSTLLLLSLPSPFAAMRYARKAGLSETELQPVLDMAVKKTTVRGQRLIWYTPTQYCQFDPTQASLGVKGCTAALYSMCVEPDGAVIPCQSYYEPLGHLLNEPWDAIWNHKLSVRLRERLQLPEKCNGCSLVPECGGGCPLQFPAGMAAAAGAQ